jgi:hypothetical protein
MEKDRAEIIAAVKAGKYKQMVTITGIFGILCFATVPISMVLYFMYSGIPPVWNVLLRTLAALFALLFELVFFTGFQHILKGINKKYDWLINLMYQTICICIAINFVAHSLEAGGVLNPQGIALDATQDGLLAQGNYLLYGSISRLLMAAYMIIICILTFKVKIFSPWISWLALIIGLINTLFIPSMFFGTNAGDFYSAIGWGNSAFAASACTWWVLIVSILLLKNKDKYR